MGVLGQDTGVRSGGSQATWSTGSDGQTWSTPDGGTATMQVVSNELEITTATGGTWAHLGTKTSPDAHALVRFSLSHTTDNVFIVLRQTASNTHYRFRSTSNGSIAKNISGTVTVLTPTLSGGTPITLAANTFYWMRAEIVTTDSSTHSSTLHMNMWADGFAEPAGWLVEVAGETSITAAGQFGLGGSLNNAANTVSFDTFYVLDYKFAEGLSASESPSFTGDTTPGLVESLSGNDSSTTYTGEEVRLTLLSADDSATSEGESWTSTNSIPATDSLLNTESYQATDLLANYALRAFGGAVLYGGIDDSASIYADTTLLIDSLSIADILSITDTPPGLLGQDTFIRPDQYGLGIATDGQAWGTPAAAYLYSVTGHTGQATGATGVGYALLGTTTPSDIEIITRLSASSKSDSFAVVLRYGSTNNQYRARANNGSFTLQRNSGGSVQALTGTLSADWPPGSVAFTLAANTFYWIRFRAVGTGAGGTANLWAKIWQDGFAEPAVWSVAASDGTFTSGRFGYLLNAGNAADSIQFNSFQAIDYINDDAQQASDALTATEDTAPGYVEGLSASDALSITQIEVPGDTALSSSDLLSASDGALLIDTDSSTSDAQSIQAAFIPIDTVPGIDSLLAQDGWTAIETGLPPSDAQLEVDGWNATDALSGSTALLSLSSYTAIDTPVLSDLLLVGDSAIFIEGLSTNDINVETPEYIFLETLSTLSSMLIETISLLVPVLTIDDGLFLVLSTYFPTDTLASTNTNINQTGIQSIVNALSIDDSTLDTDSYLPLIEQLSVSSQLSNNVENSYSFTDILSMTDSLNVESSASLLAALSQTESSTITITLITSETGSVIESLNGEGVASSLEGLSLTESSLFIDELPLVEAVSVLDLLTSEDGYTASEPEPASDMLLEASSGAWIELVPLVESLSVGGTYQPLETGTVLESLLDTGNYVIVETLPVSEDATISSNATTIFITFTDILSILDSPLWTLNVTTTESVSASDMLTTSISIDTAQPFAVTWTTRTGNVTWRTR